jgi:hypothetical protein
MDELVVGRMPGKPDVRAVPDLARQAQCTGGVPQDPFALRRMPDLEVGRQLIGEFDEVSREVGGAPLQAECRGEFIAGHHKWTPGGGQFRQSEGSREVPVGAP